jgi:hypothetical protein
MSISKQPGEPARTRNPAVVGLEKIRQLLFPHRLQLHLLHSDQDLLPGFCPLCKPAPGDTPQHGTECRITRTAYREELFELYRRHSIEKFGLVPERNDFRRSFFFRSCPGMQCEYYHEGQLLGAGFLDKSTKALSSVYFFYDPAMSHLSPGTFSILHEISLCRSMGLDYYYLGFFVPATGIWLTRILFTLGSTRFFHGRMESRPLLMNGKDYC